MNAKRKQKADQAKVFCEKISTVETNYKAITDDTRNKMIELYELNQCSWNPADERYMDRSAMFTAKTHIACELRFANGKWTWFCKFL